jgi:catechol 2,3-dioxygenase-like lactoylglutathione lyase family enzyme
MDPYLSLDHIGFGVSSLDKSIEFYSKLLNREPLMRRLYKEEYVGTVVGYENVKMDCAFFTLPNNTILELIEYYEPYKGTVDMESYNVGNAHLCLIVDNMEREIARVKDFVLMITDGIAISTNGPYKGSKVVYFRDPDGISIEVVEYPEGKSPEKLRN